MWNYLYWQWLAFKILFYKKISIISILLKVKGIKASKYKSRKFATLLLYFLKRNNAASLVYVFLICKIHLVKDLRANLLSDNNIISTKGLVIDIKGKSALIKSCKVIVPIVIRQRGQFPTRKLFASQETIILLHSKAMVLLVALFLSDNYDFLF